MTNTEERCMRQRSSVNVIKTRRWLAR